MRFQFSLRFLLTAIGVSAMLMGTLSYFGVTRAIEQRRLVNAWLKLGGEVVYDCDIPMEQTEGDVKSSLARIFPKDAVCSLRHVSIVNCDDPVALANALRMMEGNHRITSLALYGIALNGECVQAIANISSLEELFLNGTRGDGRDLRALGRMKNLNFVSLSSRKGIDKDTISAVCSVQSLRELDLSFSDVDDSTVRGITIATHLEEVCLEYTDVTREGLGVVASLPHLKIVGLDPVQAEGQADRWPNVEVQVH